MATETVTAELAARAAFMATQRGQIARVAVWEIAQIADAIQLLVDELDDDINLMFRGMGIRLEDLSGVVMSALDDECEQTAELAERVRGPAASRAQARAERAAKAIEALHGRNLAVSRQAGGR